MGSVTSASARHQHDLFRISVAGLLAAIAILLILFAIRDRGGGEPGMGDRVDRNGGNSVSEGVSEPSRRSNASTERNAKGTNSTTTTPKSRGRHFDDATSISKGREQEKEELPTGHTLKSNSHEQTLPESGEENDSPAQSESKHDGAAINGHSLESGGAEFFGIGTGGSRFVYIVDASGSMAGDPFHRACRELQRSIRRLSDAQRFRVIFFNDETIPMPARDGGAFWPADDASIKSFDQWLVGVSPDGGTMPMESLETALNAKPDAIFFLTDGRFDPSVVETVRQRNRSKTVINTVGFGEGAAVDLLRKIAEDSGGAFRQVP